MKPFVNPLSRKQPAGYPEAIAALKAATRAALGLPDETVISVSELNCRDPGCPDVETVIAIFQAGQEPKSFRIHKPIVDIVDSDLFVAIPRGAAAR